MRVIVVLLALAALVAAAAEEVKVASTEKVATRGKRG
jgi:hypothetical protein